MAMIEGIDLDHVAIAMDDVALGWPRYRGELSGVWLGGGDTPGFYCCQLQYANGMKLELLHPCRVDENDFLARFLVRSGPGPHHVTFKVPDLPTALEEVRSTGLEPVAVNLDDPLWKEAFLHPKAAPGIVVQLAESHDEFAPEPQPPNLPDASAHVPPALERVVHLVADLDAARALFVELLAGTITNEDKTSDGHVLDLAWPGPGRLRLIEPVSEALRAWLGGRPGRVHHLRFAFDSPADQVRVVEPEENLGTRLVIVGR
jgi:catechol 2,3-dioxygenase-like lactoylglutathione lyase family enzyme